MVRFWMWLSALLLMALTVADPTAVLKAVIDNEHGGNVRLVGQVQSP